MDITVCFIQEILTMIFLLPTMIILVSCRQICETNHVQFQFISWITKWITGWVENEPSNPFSNPTDKLDLNMLCFTYLPE